MAYGKIKADAIIYDNSGSDVEKTIADLATAAPGLNPTFTGDVTISAQGDVRFADSDSSHYVALQAPATVGSNVTFTLPAADGSAGQYLKTDASGNLSFGTVDTSTLMPKSGGAFTGAVTSNNTISDSKGDLRKIPNFDVTSARTLVLADAGTSLFSTVNITIPHGVFSGGDAITIINNGSNNITLTAGNSCIMYNTADATTGNRTLAGRGMATILYLTTSYCYISGSGLT